MRQADNLIGIDRALLQSLMEQVSRFGDTGDGGVDRPALSDNHKAARDWFCGELRARGYAVLIDSIGNIFGRLDLAGADAPVVMVGSHLDSQPKGGRFDGAYGVMVALAAVETWRREAAERGIVPLCNFVIVDWMNEEGARFQPSLLGSSVYAGSLGRDLALTRTDRDGRTVESELLRTGYMGSDTPPRPCCFLEVHIEGDTALETAKKTIAPFVRHWGATKIRIEVTGQQNHTGPTPMEDRHDAVLGAAYIITKVKELADTATGTLYTSVARVDISPNSPNIVPGRAVLFAELRAPEPDMLDWAETELKKAIPELAARAAVEAGIVAVERRPAGRFDDRLVNLAEQAADRFGYPRMRLDTIAGHDAVAVNGLLPAIVFAVPSVNGVIHRCEEYTSPEDLAAGGDVLLEMMRQIDKAGGSLDRPGGAK